MPIGMPPIGGWWPSEGDAGAGRRLPWPASARGSIHEQFGRQSRHRERIGEPGQTGLPSVVSFFLRKTLKSVAV